MKDELSPAPFRDGRPLLFPSPDTMEKITRKEKQKRVCQNRHALFAFIVSQAAQQDETFFPRTPVFPFPSSHKEGKGRIGRKMQPCRAEK